MRKYYRTTPLGEQALDEARGKIRELVDEIMDDARTRRGRGGARVARRPAPLQPCSTTPKPCKRAAKSATA